MEEPNEDLPSSLWSQTTAIFHLLRRRSRREDLIPSVLTNPMSLTLSIIILLVFITFVILPPILSQADQIVTASSLMKSWDSLNMLLVLFAILCGIFAKRNEELLSSSDHQLISESSDTFPISESVSSTDHNFSGLKLRRNSRTFTDLRDESLWGDFGDASELKFYDDTEVNFKRSSQKPENSHRRSRRSHRAVQPNSTPTFHKKNVDKECSPEVEPGLKLRRNSRTYPDLRDESLWGDVGDESELRFSDDSEVNFNRSSQPRENSHRRSRRSYYRAEKEEAETLARREIQREDFIHNSVPALSKSPPFEKKQVERQKNEQECTPMEVESGLKLRRNSRTFPDLRDESSWGVGDISDLRFSDDSEVNSNRYSQPPENSHRRSRRSHYRAEAETALVRHEIPAPPPPPAAISKHRPIFRKKTSDVQLIAEDTIDKIQIKMSETTKEIATAITSIYKNQIKRKSTKVKTKEIVETQNPSPPRTLLPPSTPPPPPPPPPPVPRPSKIFQNLFKKSNISKQVKKVTFGTPPLEPEENLRKRHVSIGKPPKHKTPSVMMYNESVLMAAPPPRLFLMPPPPLPPPPPFRATPESKFVAREEDVEEMPVVKSEDRDSTMPSSYCPSPDVNAKADNFIARLRDGWKLDKMNSFNEREGNVG